MHATSGTNRRGTASSAKNTEKNEALDWKSEHDITFNKNKKLISEITQNKHFNQNVGTGVICDESIVV